MSYIGVNKEGVENWKGRLNTAHHKVIEAITNYKKIAAQSSEHAKGSNFTRINSQCEQITGKQIREQNDLHSEYTKATDKLVQGVIDIAGH